MWHYTASGEYSVKSGYRIAVQKLEQARGPQASSSFIPHKNLWSGIWKLEVPHKVRHFWWRACSNNLATKDNLVRGKCGMSRSCTICGGFD